MEVLVSDHRFLRLYLLEEVQSYAAFSACTGIAKEDYDRRLKNLRTSDEWAKADRVKRLFKAKKRAFLKESPNEEFGVTASQFYDWYVSEENKLDFKCAYCKTREEELKALHAKLVGKRKIQRGKNLEVERRDPKLPYNRLENLTLACYFCNNAKSDEFSEEEFRPIGDVMAGVLRLMIKNRKAVSPAS